MSASDQSGLHKSPSGPNGSTAKASAVSGLLRLAEAGFRLIIAPLQQKASFLPRLPKWSSARIWPQQLEFGSNNWPQQEESGLCAGI
jgi:hypothetical protein